MKYYVIYVIKYFTTFFASNFLSYFPLKPRCVLWSEKYGKWKGGKQFIRYRVYSNDCKATQQHKKRHKNTTEYQSEIKDAISEINNILEGINRRLDEAEDQISDLEYKVGK